MEDPKALERVLKVMYGYDYKQFNMTRDEFVGTYALAYRIDVPAVAATIGQEVKALMVWNLRNDKPGGLDDDFAKYVRIAYNEVPDGAHGADLLREPLIKTAATCLKTWTFTQLKFALGPAFRSSGSFAVDVMARRAGKPITC